MRLDKIHKGILFKESEWLKPYIEANSKLRSRTGISDFKKDFYKLLSNSVFVETCENIRDRTNIKPVGNVWDLRKEASKVLRIE